MTDKMETPKPENDAAHNEWLERQIDKQLDDKVWDKLKSPTLGSFKGMAEVEKRLKRKKS